MLRGSAEVENLCYGESLRDGTILIVLGGGPSAAGRGEVAGVRQVQRLAAEVQETAVDEAGPDRGDLAVGAANDALAERVGVGGTSWQNEFALAERVGRTSWRHFNLSKHLPHFVRRMNPVPSYKRIPNNNCIWYSWGLKPYILGERSEL